MEHVYNGKINLHKTIFLVIFLFSTSILLQSTNENNFITSKSEWSICSPVIKETLVSGQKKRNQDQHSLDFLQNQGEMADQLWVSTKDKSNLISAFNNIFAPIDRDFLNNLIDQILSNDTLLDQITKASYRNVTGFLKIVLVDGGKNSWKIRLHAWEKKEKKEFPHNHKWDFYSKIISGYLSQEIYDKNNNACAISNPYSIREPVSLMPIPASGELPCPCRDNYVLNPKNTDSESASLQVQSKNIIAAGESYFMPYHLIHSITPGKSAISLIFTSQQTQENSEVFVPMDMVDTDLTRNAPSITKDELRSELLIIKQILNQLHLQEAYLPEAVDNTHTYFSKKNNDPIFNTVNWRHAINKSKTQQNVAQLSSESMQHFAVSANQDGKVLINGNPIDPAHDYLFVVFQGVMYAAPKDFHHKSGELICHCSFTDYGPVDSAGVLRFDNDGSLTTIEAYSGHYAPSKPNMEVARNHLQSIGVKTEGTSLIAYQDRS